jgi:hypothetical protein
MSGMVKSMGGQNGIFSTLSMGKNGGGNGIMDAMSQIGQGQFDFKKMFGSS